MKEKKALATDFRGPPIRKAYREQEATALKNLERQWAVEDWAEEMDTAKLEVLGRIFKTRNAKWDTAAVLDELSSSGDQNEVLPRKQTAHKPMMEHHTIGLLRAIKREKRTPEQKAALHVLVKRQLGREAYRRKQLLDTGMTEEEIDAEGGPDAVYARKGKEMQETERKRYRGPRHVEDESAKRVGGIADREGAWHPAGLCQKGMGRV